MTASASPCAEFAERHGPREKFYKVPGMEIAAVCEIDGNVLGAWLADIKKLDLPEPHLRDVRKQLEAKSV